MPILARVNPIRPDEGLGEGEGGKGEGGGEVPAPISNFENFLDIK